MYLRVGVYCSDLARRDEGNGENDGGGEQGRGRWIIGVVCAGHGSRGK